MTESMNRFREMYARARSVVFFGGAGVSTASKIPDFRSKDGLYKSRWAYPPETILSRSFLMARPEIFFDFFRKKMVYPDARPNGAHTALARMEKAGKLSAVVTQNIDGLHTMAGSGTVLELHGSVHRCYCTDCGRPYPLSHIMEATGVPRCGACGGMVRPDVILYGEALDSGVISRALGYISAARLLIVGGTSLTVHPAASFIRVCQGSLVIINRSPTDADASADLVFREPIDEVLTELIGDG